MPVSEALANGLLTVLNGLWVMLGFVANPITVIIVAMAAAFAWLALLENDELDRQATKPSVGVGQ